MDEASYGSPGAEGDVGWKAIEIHAFVPMEDIDPIRIGDGYYLQAGGTVASSRSNDGQRGAPKSGHRPRAPYPSAGVFRRHVMRAHPSIALHRSPAIVHVLRHSRPDSAFVAGRDLECDHHGLAVR
ncbi:hypothetical protein GCM10018783_01190 [Streptomyces griseosporeus]|nr:hypothetical protein GCM10018783_01190 [Streptomyces griseosporeus]